MRGYQCKPVLSSHHSWPLGWTVLDWVALDWKVLDWKVPDWTALGYWSLTLVMKQAPRIHHSPVGRRPR